jgi:hypothetical protein
MVLMVDNKNPVLEDGKAKQTISAARKVPHLGHSTLGAGAA